ncbi:MAG: glycosyltransferase [Pirellulaceae bacterium]
MRILLIGETSDDSFAGHISETLVAMGHTAETFTPWRFGESFDVFPGVRKYRRFAIQSASHFTGGRKWILRNLWRQIERMKPELVLCCYDYLLPREVDQVRAISGAKIVMWYPDSLANFGRACFMASRYDALFFKDPFVVRALKGALESPVHYLPECFNPRRLDPPAHDQVPLQWRSEIATVGNLHPWRMALLKKLEPHSVRIWGPPPSRWLPQSLYDKKYQGRPVLNQEKCLAFRGAKIVLNNLHYSEIEGLNCRCFEAAGSGAFQLLDWRPTLPQLFQEGQEVVSFRSPEEMVEKVRYWLPREDERREIGDRARQRALAEHTFEHRLSRLLNILEGSESGDDVP